MQVTKDVKLWMRNYLLEKWWGKQIQEFVNTFLSLLIRRMTAIVILNTSVNSSQNNNLPYKNLNSWSKNYHFIFRTKQKSFIFEQFIPCGVGIFFAFTVHSLSLVANFLDQANILVIYYIKCMLLIIISINFSS